MKALEMYIGAAYADKGGCIYWVSLNLVTRRERKRKEVQLGMGKSRKGMPGDPRHPVFY